MWRRAAAAAGRRGFRATRARLSAAQPDHYGALGLNRTASADQIKRAYLRLAKKLHPDASGQATAEQFANVNEAYKVLSDPQRRQLHDMAGDAAGRWSSGAAGAAAHPSSEGVNQWGDMNFNYGGTRDGPVGQGMGVDMGRMWEDLFGGGQGTKQAKHSQKYQPQKGGDITVKLKLSFLEAVEGCKREVSYNYLRRCSPCKGTGSKDGSPRVRCNVCHGRGKQMTTNGYYHIEQACSACGGSGEVVKALCATCGGKGVSRDRTTQQVAVPAGVDSHDRLRVAGKGEAGTRGGPSGHLYIDLVVDEHAVFTRDGEDIHVILPVTLSQAVLGAKVPLPTLAGDVTVTVPGGTQQGDRVVLRGKGIRKPQQSRVGDQHVHFCVLIPKQVSPEQRIAIERFAEEEDRARPSPERFRELKHRCKRWIEFKAPP